MFRASQRYYREQQERQARPDYPHIHRKQSGQQQEEDEAAEQGGGQQHEPPAWIFPENGKQQDKLTSKRYEYRRVEEGSRFGLTGKEQIILGLEEKCGAFSPFEVAAKECKEDGGRD
jgi:hypothetical protein